MKTYKAGRRSSKNPRVRSRANNKPTGRRINDFLNAGLLFVLIGVFALVFPVLTARHHAKQHLIFLWQPMHETLVEESNSDTVSPVVPEGAIPILIGCTLVGLGAALKS